MSNARSPTSGFGSIASQGSRSAASTFPPWKSWCRTTTSGCEERRSRRALSARSRSERSKGCPSRSHAAGMLSSHTAATSVRSRNGWFAIGARQTRRRTPAAISFARSSSASPQSWVPGTHRSTSSAERASSRARSLTAPRPSQAASASGSSALSGSGNASFRTASDPSGRVAGTTREMVAGSKGAPSRSVHTSAHSDARRGSRPSQSAPPGCSRHHSRPRGSAKGILDAANPAERRRGRASVRGPARSVAPARARS